MFALQEAPDRTTRDIRFTDRQVCAFALFAAEHVRFEAVLAEFPAPDLIACRLDRGEQHWRVNAIARLAAIFVAFVTMFASCSAHWYRAHDEVFPDWGDALAQLAAAFVESESVPAQHPTPHFRARFGDRGGRRDAFTGEAPVNVTLVTVFTSRSTRQLQCACDLRCRRRNSHFRFGALAHRAAVGVASETVLAHHGAADWTAYLSPFGACAHLASPCVLPEAVFAVHHAHHRLACRLHQHTVTRQTTIHVSREAVHALLISAMCRRAGGSIGACAPFASVGVCAIAVGAGQRALQDRAPPVIDGRLWFGDRFRFHLDTPALLTASFVTLKAVFALDHARHVRATRSVALAHSASVVVLSEASSAAVDLTTHLWTSRWCASGIFWNEPQFYLKLNMVSSVAVK